jgi:hypothetical protein
MGMTPGKKRPERGTTTVAATRATPDPAAKKKPATAIAKVDAKPAGKADKSSDRSGKRDKAQDKVADKTGDKTGGKKK